MPRVEGAGDICFRRPRPRPTQGCRADDDDDDDDSILTCSIRGLNMQKRPYFSKMIVTLFVICRFCVT